MFKKNLNVTCSYAWSTGSVSTYHNANTGTFKFLIDSSNKVFISGSDSSVGFYQIKGVVLIICWIFLNFVGVYATVYLKHLTYWIHIHGICSGISAFLTFASGLYSVIDCIFFFIFRKQRKKL